VGGRRYVDVNVFIYWLGSHPLYGERAREWIERIENSRKRTYCTSALTIYEALIIIAGLLGKKLKDRGYVGKVIDAFRELDNLEIIPLTERVIHKALELMMEYGLDYEDSLHLATALISRAKEIVSNDKDFDKTPIKRVF
jgi:predicted nucleic acid-binding protein